MVVTACGGTSATAKPAASATRSASTAATAAGAPGAGTGTGTGTAASGKASAVPAGYVRIGGAKQGISLAVPKSWIRIDATEKTIENAARNVNFKGVSSAEIMQSLRAIQNLNGIAVYDLDSNVIRRQHFAPNLSAYCSASGITDAGAAGVPFLKSVMANEAAKLHAKLTSQRDLQVGGVPGTQISYQITSLANGTDVTNYGWQVVVLPKPDKVCYMTLTTRDTQTAANIINVAAATAEFP
jgi:hypothetical protein